MPLLFKNYSLLEVMYLLIRFSKSKSFLWNTNNMIEIEIVIEQDTHTTQRGEETNFRKGRLLLVIAPLFRTIRPILPTPHFLWKFWPLPPFWGNIQKLNHPIYKEGVSKYGRKLGSKYASTVYFSMKEKMKYCSRSYKQLDFR